MIETIFYYGHYALTLLFGIVLSFAFCGLRFIKKTNYCVLFLFALCGMAQLLTTYFLGETATWELYPLITHLPIGIVLSTVFRRKVTTVISSISLSYLCCQPSKWFGMFTELFTDNGLIILCIRIVILILVAFSVLRFFASYISEIYGKDSYSVMIIGSIPLIYYVFDYIVGIYTDLRNQHVQLIAEFLSFFLCVAFVAFCVIYYKEYEKKADAERREQIIEITAQQQIKEIDAMKKSNLEAQLFRHDIRFLLSNLSLCIEKGDMENARNMIAGFTEKVTSSSLQRYCENDTVNYILANFKNRCANAGIEFNTEVKIGSLAIDEILLSSIISNALDNAIQAQSDVAEANRQIRLMLKESNGKLLLSVKNPYGKSPVFINGLPVSDKEGHGFGTQSIRYMTEKLGGKCQFILQNNMFVLRVVL